MSRTQWSLPAIVAVGLALMAAGPASALPGPLGSLFADPAATGCVAGSVDANCNVTAPVAGAADVAASPDGRHAYVAASGSSALIGLSVDATGAPTMTGASCFSSSVIASCSQVRGLGGVASVAVSPDGAHLYTAAKTVSAVAAFARDAASGALTVPATPCVADEVQGPLGLQPSEPGCVAVQGLAGATDLAISPDGAHVYVASSRAGAVALLERDAIGGSLVQPAAPSSCVATLLIAGNPPVLSDAECATSAPLAGASAIAISPDGRHVYVTAVGSRAVTVFARNAASGALSEGSCVSHDIGAAGLPTPAAAGCLAVAGLGDPTSIALSPNGAHAYVTSTESSTIASFRRDPRSGALAPLAQAHCIADAAAASPGCAPGVGLDGADDVIVSGDGSHVYIAAGDAVAAFARNGSTGALTQLAGPHACLRSGSVLGGCSATPRLEGATALAQTPGGRHVVVAASRAGAVVSLERQLAPRCRSTTVTGVAGPTPVPLPCGDPNGDALTFELVSTPRHGTVTSIDHVSSAATYAPGIGAAERDAFSFVAVDDGGAAGAPALASLELASFASAALTDAVVRDTRAPQLRSGKLVFEGRRRVRIKLRCPTHEIRGCRGTITIRTARRIPVRILRKTRLAAGPRAKARRVVLVKDLPFRLKGAVTRSVSTTLRKKHLRLLKRMGRTRVDVRVVARDAAGNVGSSKRRIVLQPPKRR